MQEPGPSLPAARLTLHPSLDTSQRRSASPAPSSCQRDGAGRTWSGSWACLSLRLGRLRQPKLEPRRGHSSQAQERPARPPPGRLDGPGGPPAAEWSASTGSESSPLHNQSSVPWPLQYIRPHRTRDAPPGGAREASTCRQGRKTPCPGQSTGLPSVAAPKMASAASSSTKAWTKAGARKWSDDGSGGVGAAVVPVPRASSNPARATNTLVHGGETPPPLAWRR